MKKLLLYTLAATLAVGLFGCADETASTSTTTTTEETVVQPAHTTVH
jgi:hypothetical protein